MFPKIIGHRGAPHLAPENTLASFQAAIEQGVDGIELDVQLTRDGYLVVCHDERIDRTTDGSGFIKDLSLKELRGFSAGLWYSEAFKDQRIPELKEVFELVKRANIIVNVEIKNGIILYKDIEKKLIDTIHRFELHKNTIISSFNHYSLITCKRIDPSIKTGILYMAGLVEPWEYAKKIQADAIHPYFYNIRPVIMKGAKANNIMVNPFTVNEIEDMKYMIKMEVDCIITDWPDRMIKLRNDMEFKL